MGGRVSILAPFSIITIDSGLQGLQMFTLVIPSGGFPFLFLAQVIYISLKRGSNHDSNAVDLQRTAQALQVAFAHKESVIVFVVCRDILLMMSQSTSCFLDARNTDNTANPILCVYSSIVSYVTCYMVFATTSWALYPPRNSEIKVKFNKDPLNM